jgi:hypothetical protein
MTSRLGTKEAMVPGRGRVLQSDIRAGGAAGASLVKAKREACSGLWAFEDDEFSFHGRR